MTMINRQIPITTKFICDVLGVSISGDKEYAFMKFAISAEKNDVAFIIDKGAEYNVAYTMPDDRCLELADIAMHNGASLLVAANQIRDYPCIVVNNVVEAYKKLCEAYRILYTFDAIAITGSIGKTTTTHFVHTLFASKWKTLSSVVMGCNQFRDAGLAVQNLQPEHKFYVQEVSEGPPYGIAGFTSKIIKPSVAVITKIAPAHMNRFHSLEEITESCFCIQKGMDDDGLLILNGDDPYQVNTKTRLRKVYYGVQNSEADYKAINIKTSLEGTSFDLVYDSKTVPINIRYIGEHNVYCALAAITAAKLAGMSDLEIQNAITKCEPKGIRQKFLQIGRYNLYLDAFNSSPESMVSAINLLNILPRKNENSKRIAVLADMEWLGDMGAEEHRIAGEYIANLDIDILVAYGEESVNMADVARQNPKLEILHTTDESILVKLLLERITGDDIALIKGGRHKRLDCILDKAFGTWFSEAWDCIRPGQHSIVTESSFEVALYQFEHANKIFALYRFPLSFAKILRYQGDERNITIPEIVQGVPVWGLQMSAFSERSDIENIQFADTIRNIRWRTFYKCNGLTVVKLPAQLNLIFKNAFEACENLKEVIMGDKVIDIDNHAFLDCTNLKKINIPPSVERISDDAFMNCPKLTIYGQLGSYSENYAKRNNIPFESMFLVNEDII